MKCQICNKTISDFEYQPLNGECEECQGLSEQQWYDYQFKTAKRFKMSKKITFEEWFHQCGFHKDGYDCNQVSSAHSAWHFCQAQEQQEISELKKKVEEIGKVRDFLESELSIALGAFSKTEKERLELKKKVEELWAWNDGFAHKLRLSTDGIKKLHNENESLKKKLEKAEEVIRFYGDPEKWMIKTSDHWTKSSPRTYGDSELREDYSHPNKDWVGSIVVGGKRARAYLKENEL